MAFRIEALFGAVLICAAAGGGVPARHLHWRGAGEGTIDITEEGISFRESGRRGAAHSQQWSYADIQQVVLGARSARVLSYADSKWKLGRDEEHRFDGLPADFAAQVYPLLRKKLGAKAIAAFASEQAGGAPPIGAKLLEGTRGSRGVLRITAAGIEFDTPRTGNSRSWPFADIDNISRPGPHEFTLTTFEKSGLRRLPAREFRFQLEQPLSVERYEDWWRSLNRTKFSVEVNHHD